MKKKSGIYDLRNQSINSIVMLQLNPFKAIAQYTGILYKLDIVSGPKRYCFYLGLLKNEKWIYS